MTTGSATSRKHQATTNLALGIRSPIEVSLGKVDTDHLAE
jgi:hypothetical protein